MKKRIKIWMLSLAALAFLIGTLWFASQSLVSSEVNMEETISVLP